MRKIAVVGLGRFGTAVVRNLAGTVAVQVIAIDAVREIVDDIKDVADVAVSLDSTDERALRAQEIDKVDVLVVAIGENFEAALLTTLLAKKLGVPRVICRASSPDHAQIFRQIGADEVIQPESETGIQLARTLSHPFLEDFIDLGEGFSLIELHAPSVFRGKSLRELNLRVKYNVNLVALRRDVTITEKSGEITSQESIAVPQADEIIKPDDILVLIGADSDLARLPKE